MNQTTEASTIPSPADEIAAVTTPTRVPLHDGEPLTLVEVFEHVARVHPRPDTLNYKKDGRWLSIPAAEMLKRVHTIAAGLYSLGVRRGDRVAILSESRPEWVLADAGCMFATAIDVPIYPTLTTPQVRYILKDSGARVLMIQNEEKFQRVREAIAECSAIEHVVFFEKPAGAEAVGISLTELEGQGRTLQATQPDLILKAAHLLKPDDLATIIYTSGTTGEPERCDAYARESRLKFDRLLKPSEICPERQHAFCFAAIARARANGHVYVSLSRHGHIFR